MHIAQIWWYTNSLSVCLYTAKSVQCALLFNVQGQLSMYRELLSHQKKFPNLSTVGQENATFEAKNTNPRALIPKPGY